VYAHGLRARAERTHVQPSVACKSFLHTSSSPVRVVFVFNIYIIYVIFLARNRSIQYNKFNRVRVCKTTTTHFTGFIRYLLCYFVLIYCAAVRRKGEICIYFYIILSYCVRFDDVLSKIRYSPSAVARALVHVLYPVASHTKTAVFALRVCRTVCSSSPSEWLQYFLLTFTVRVQRRFCDLAFGSPIAHLWSCCMQARPRIRFIISLISRQYCSTAQQRKIVDTVVSQLGCAAVRSRLPRLITSVRLCGLLQREHVSNALRMYVHVLQV
jgi:hypothetical protein